MVKLDEHQAAVRRRYAELAQARSSQGGCCGEGSAEFDDPRFGAALYDATPESAEALALSLGCGDPVQVAELRPGERVVDLGSGGGLDVLLSARRVGPQGFVYGIDMTPEMVQVARQNAAQAGISNVEFRLGVIEDLPLADASIDVVISNCVINLSGDKPRVLREIYRVLAPGGRIGLSDVVADDTMSVTDRVQAGRSVGCVAGALSIGEYLAELAAAGFCDPTVEYTHDVAPGMHAAIIKANKPG